MWRCLNDIFGYCTGKPTFDTPPSVLSSLNGKPIKATIPDVGGTCTKNLATCRKHTTLQKHLNQLSKLHPSRVPAHIIIK